MALGDNRDLACLSHFPACSLRESRAKASITVPGAIPATFMLINGWVASLNISTRIEFKLLVVLVMLVSASGNLVVTAAETLPVGPITFEAHVRPILKANCFHCHGEGDKPQSGLDLRLRRFIVKGGETGPAIVPGKPAESTLLDYLRDGEMPPPEVEKRLTPNEIAVV